MIETKDGLSISEAAQHLKLPEDTLRYYERIGLTPPIKRAGSGHRRYTSDDLKRFQFVMRMRATGMSIETLQHYAELTRDGEHTAATRRALLIEHRAKVKAQIEALHAALEAVEQKIARLDSGAAHK